MMKFKLLINISINKITKICKEVIQNKKKWKLNKMRTNKQMKT